MKIASVPTSFTLAGGYTLIVAAGTRWDTIGRLEPRQGWPAEAEIIRLHERIAALTQAINAARAVYGGSPLE